jgi:hypothetical protein
MTSRIFLEHDEDEEVPNQLKNHVDKPPTIVNTYPTRVSKQPQSSNIDLPYPERLSLDNHSLNSILIS